MSAATWYEQVQRLRAELDQDPHRVGSEALRLLEDWLYESAQQLGMQQGLSGMRDYTDFVAKRGRLSKEEAARIRRYTDVRNCLAHRAGLLISPTLADELLDFLTVLFRSSALSAEQLMTPDPRTVTEQEPLGEIRDWMLRRAVSRLPVMRGERVVGLLTNRDLLLCQEPGQPRGQSSQRTVADAMSADSAEQLAFLPRRAPYDEVLTTLQKRHIAAILVTEHGSPNEPLLGIITPTNLLPKL